MILVVAGHTEFPFTNWIYLFHVACFFMVSGYFWNDKNSSSLESIGIYIKKRMKRLYIPFLLANIIALSFHNYLLRHGLYCDNPTFLEITKDYPVSQSLSSYRDFGETISFIGKSFLLIAGGAKIVSTCWFLSTLILIELMQSLFRFIVLRLFQKDSKTIIYDITLIVLSMALCFLSQSGLVNLPSKVLNVLLAYTAYLLGNFIRIVEREKIYNIWTCIVSFVFLIVLSYFGSVDISKCVFTNPLFYCTGAICGWIFIKFIATVINKYLHTIGNILVSIGRHTMAILLLHFLCFKAVSWVFVLITGSSSLLIATHPSIYNSGLSWLWFCYVIVGVFAPLFMDLLYERFKNSIRIQFAK